MQMRVIIEGPEAAVNAAVAQQLLDILIENQQARGFEPLKTVECRSYRKPTDQKWTDEFTFKIRP